MPATACMLRQRTRLVAARCCCFPSGMLSAGITKRKQICSITFLPSSVTYQQQALWLSASCRPLQTASEGTLEEAEGVYVSMMSPDDPLTAPVSMARFTALRRLWLRQATATTLRGVQLSKSTGLRYVGPHASPSCKRALHPSLALHSCTALRQFGLFLASVRVTCQWIPPQCWLGSTSHTQSYARMLRQFLTRALLHNPYPRPPRLRRDLVLDAEPMPAIRGTGPCAPFDLDLGALTALTRLELRGYATDSPHEHGWRQLLSPGAGRCCLRIHEWKPRCGPLHSTPHSA